MRGRWSLLSLVALVVIFAGLAQTSQGHAVLRYAGLYKVPTSYTELSFTHPRSLPSGLTLAKGAKGAKGQVSVSFGVHNVSGSARSYHWSIAVVREGKSQVKAAGNLGVPAQGRTTVTRSVTEACASVPNFEVVVRLATPAESIDFWVLCPPSPAPAKAKGGTRKTKGGAG